MRATLLHRSAAAPKRDRRPGRTTQRAPARDTAPARRRGRPLRVVGAVVLAAALAAGCTGDDPAPGAGATAPDVPAPAGAGTVAPASVAPRPEEAAEPGTVIEATPVAPPAGARAWLLRYHSTAASGDDVGVTGLLVVPDAPPPPGGFPLVTWAHPTTGAADGCEPSADGPRSIPFVEDLVADGWAVVATDYEGLGAEGAHPYLVGDSEGHAVLDAARAASRVEGSGVEPSSPTAIWGFSQGGHAAAFAAQLAPSYAPELDLVGVAVAAPVSDVAGFTARAEGMADQLGVVLTVVNGFAAAYPELDPATVLTPAGLELLADVEHRCIGEINEAATRPPAEVLATPPTRDPAFAARFAQSRAGDAPVGVPVLVVQGADDDIVDPAATAALVERWCALGVDVESVVRPGVDHGVLSADPYVGWLADRFAGRPTTPTC